ncbi:hypothetical protein D9M72_639350 [compost metagenome]
MLSGEQGAKALGLGSKLGDLGLRRTDCRLGRLEIGVQFRVALAGLLNGQPGVLDFQLKGFRVEPKQ